MKARTERRTDSPACPSLPISVLIQTKNEERSIERCVRGVDRFGEVIVVDSGSSDRTVEIAQQCGAQVEQFQWNGQYPKKKQWQLDNLLTRYAWILFLDADEAPSDELLEELAALDLNDTSTDVGAYSIRLRYHFGGRTLRFGHVVRKTVLVRRDRCRFPRIEDANFPGMGELEGHYQPTILGRTRSLTGKLMHHDRDPVSTWFDRHNKYSDWEARLHLTKKTKQVVNRSRSKQGRLFYRLPMKPVVFFLYSYIARAGLLDGRAGLDYAIALSHYYWQIGLKVRELERDA